GLLLIFAGVLAAMPIVRVPISVQARGIMRGVADPRVVTASTDAEVIRVVGREAGKVAEGDTLVVLARPELRLQRLALEQRRAWLAEERARVEGLVRDAAVGMDDEGAGWMTLGELVRLETRARLQGRLAEMRAEDLALQHQAQLLKMEADALAVIAPVGGTMDWMAAVTVGTRVRAGQEIAKIAPISDIVAELEVSSDAVAALAQGDEVVLRIDGFAAGGVRVVSGRIVEPPDILHRPGGPPVGRMRVRPISAEGGDPRPVFDELRGLAVTAYLPAGTRSLWSLVVGRRDGQGSESQSESWGRPQGTGNRQG